jgi:DNA-binding NarL/FixJ family response regulator
VRERPRRPIRTVLVDDHLLVSAAVERLLQMVPDIEVVGAAGGGTEAVSLVGRVRPDVVLMDLSMPDGDGVEATQAITTSFPAVRVLAFSAYAEPELVADALDAGATGYLLKVGNHDELVRAIRAVARGRRWLSPQAAIALRTLRPGPEA